MAVKKKGMGTVERRDGKKEIEPSHINELHVVFGMFRDFLPSRLEKDLEHEAGGREAEKGCGGGEARTSADGCIGG
jgi:hypothetical protein